MAENRQLFDNRVYNPVVLEVMVADKRNAKVAQHFLNSINHTFTCLSRKDYLTFNEHLVDGKSAGRRLRLHVVEFSKTNAPELRDQRPPMSTEELRKYGFDSYLLDFLDGPAPVLNTVCHLSQVHQIPISTREFSADEHEGIKNATSDGRPLYSRYVVTNSEIRINRAYGEVNTSTETIQNKGDIYSLSIDRSVQESLKREIALLQDSLNAEVEVLQQKEQRRKHLAEEIKAADKEKEEMSKKRTSLLQKVSDYNTAETKANSARDQLRRREMQPLQFQDNIASIKAEYRELIKKHTGFVQEYQVEIKSLRNVYAKSVILQANEIQASANKRVFETHNSTIQCELMAAEREFNIFKERKADMFSRAKQLNEEATEALANISEEDKLEMQAMPDDTTEEDLRSQIDDIKTRLSFLAEANGNVLQLYEERAREIAVLAEEIEHRLERIDKLSKEIRDRRDIWEAALSRIIKDIDNGFSDAFKSINCVGEIKLGNKEEEAERWSIEIWVQFR